MNGPPRKFTRRAAIAGFVTVALLVLSGALFCRVNARRHRYLMSPTVARDRCRGDNMLNLYGFLTDEWRARHSRGLKSVFNNGRVDYVPLEPGDTMMPSRLGDVVNTYGPSSLHWCLCPGVHNDPRYKILRRFMARQGRSSTNSELWSDYIYVPWTNGFDAPAHYPLIYDRKLANHGGKGINVFTVRGEPLWDGNAEWLQKFAREHPDLDIPLPDDLPEG